MRPRTHYDLGGKALCGAAWINPLPLTDRKERVTCQRCLHALEQQTAAWRWQGTGRT